MKSQIDYMYQHGLVSTENDPYLEHENTCDESLPRMSEKIATQPVSVFLNGDEKQLMEILAIYGPVVITLHASDRFSFYESGISDKLCPSNCKGTNHAVLLVGYGTDAETYSQPFDFWLIKNSYGFSWGEDGYIRMIRNSKNNCNVACYIDYAEV
jgi:C1A family cysteine protease